MIEIFGIFLQFLIFLIIFTFPFTPKILNKYLTNDFNFSFIDSHAINIIFFCYCSLMISLTSIKLEIFFYIYLTLCLIFITSRLKEYFLYIKKTNNITSYLFVLIGISLFILIAQDLRLEWDGHFWLEKALVFFNNESIEEIANTKVQPEYPHLGTYIWAFFWKNSLLQVEFFGRFFYIYFYLVSVFLIFGLLENKNIYILASLIIFFIILTFDKYLFAGYQEYLIFSTLVVFSRFFVLVNFDKKSNIKFITLLILILFLPSWFKKEGLIYYGIFSATLIYYLKYSLKTKILLSLFLILLFIFHYLVYNFIVNNYNFNTYLNLNIIINNVINVDLLVERTFKIILHFIIAFLKYPFWIIIMISFYLNLFLFKANKNILIYFLYCGIFNFLFLFSIFFTFENLDFMLRLALDRLIFQTSGFYSVLFILLLNQKNLTNLR